VGFILAGWGRLPAAERRPIPPSRPSLTAEQLAERIDAELSQSWTKAGIQPAQPATDAEFLRRVYLDLNGRIPPVAVVRSFLSDQRSAKRVEIVETLLARGAHAAHLANTWRDQMLAGAAGNLEARQYIPQFDMWLKLRFAAGTPYDQIVGELLTTTPSRQAMRAVRPGPAAPSPLAFYEANQRKPEQLAASTSRVFLGVQVQCAQCHNHFFADWKQEQFWSLAAFFSGIEADAAAGNPLEKVFGSRKLKIPDTDTYVEPQFLDGTSPDWSSGQSRRAMLAQWITSPENPWFAKAAVNRLWEHFFGRGFVHPVDDLDPANKPSHQELFDELAAQFTLHQYDVKYLIRAITLTKAYQLSSRGQSKDEDLAHFARIPLRRMTGDQLLDSIVQATGYRERSSPRSQFVIDDGLGSVRAEFQAKFSEQSLPRTEAETSILQALAMMNGKLIGDVVNLKTSETLVAVADSPFFDTRGRIEALFLATFSRPPEPEELEKLAAYVDSGGPTKDGKAALADVFWALLNSAEFVLCH
jgi:hypothetical protein